MPRKSKKKSSSSRALKKLIVAEPGLPIPIKPTTEVVTEQREITTEPEVEIRRPATLAQALTERAVAVVKPKTRVKKILETHRRVA